MKKYWACSKFADWVRGTPKPQAATSEEWKIWENKAKKKKYRYWLAEEGIDYFESVICWPANRFRDICCYINNRWVGKSHALISNLARGSWHDFDTRLIHATFDELVNFVEIELAWMLVICDDEKRKKYNIPWSRSFFYMCSWRCPEAGLEYLEWACNLKNDDDWMNKDDPDYGQPTQQALAARETFKLYKWWKEERPQRPDAFEASGWDEYCKAKRNEIKADDDDLLFGFMSSSKKDERMVALLKKCHEIEKEQLDEDTDMLVRLVKIRSSLWT